MEKSYINLFTLEQLNKYGLTKDDQNKIAVLVNKAINELAKALKETNGMSEHEPNSLLKLLSIENPAKLPERQKISADSSLILQAIQELSMDMHRSFNRKRIIDGGSANLNDIMLPNGQIVKNGDHIYDNNKKR